MTDDQFQELRQLLGGNREAIEGNREAIEGNRQAIEGNREAIEGNRQAIEGNREAIEGNRQAIANTDGRLDRHISAVDERFEHFEVKLAEEGRRTRAELSGRIDAVESRLEVRIETTVDGAFQKLMGLTASMFEHQTGQFQRLFELTGSMFEHQTGEFRKLEARLDAALGEETRG